MLPNGLVSVSTFFGVSGADKDYSHVFLNLFLRNLWLERKVILTLNLARSWVVLDTKTKPLSSKERTEGLFIVVFYCELIFVVPILSRVGYQAKTWSNRKGGSSSRAHVSRSNSRERVDSEFSHLTSASYNIKLTLKVSSCHKNKIKFLRWAEHGWLYGKNLWAHSWTGFNNVVLPTLLTVVINTEQYSWNWIGYNNIVQCWWQLWTMWAAQHCSILFISILLQHDDFYECTSSVMSCETLGTPCMRCLRGICRAQTAFVSWWY